MKIMLLTAATGGGHLRASAAVEQYIRDNTGYEVVTIDTLKAVNRFLDKSVCDTYRFMAKRIPAMFGRLYKQTNREKPALRPGAQAQRGLQQPAVRQHFQVPPGCDPDHPPLCHGNGFRPEGGWLDHRAA